MFLDGQQDLAGVDGLEEIVGNLGADGFVHDSFFFALGDHDYRQGREVFFDFVKGFHTRQAGHLFVEENDIDGLVAEGFHRIHPVVERDYFVAFGLKEHHMGFEEVDFVVDPEDSCCCHLVLFLVLCCLGLSFLYKGTFRLFFRQTRPIYRQQI